MMPKNIGANLRLKILGIMDADNVNNEISQAHKQMTKLAEVGPI